MTKINAKDATVLIVEDNTDSLFILTDILREDLKVRRTGGWGSGREMFSQLERDPTLQPDLILLDLQMPHQDGFAVLRQIRATPLLAGVRVVAITANVLPQDVEQARAAGFDGFIGKPIDMERFPEQVQRVLNGRPVWEPRK